MVPPMVLHISKFSWDKSASLRGQPLVDTSAKLLERYAVEGFVTSTEPLLVAHDVSISAINWYGEKLTVYIRLSFCWSDVVRSAFTH
jgi:hypothetical protein